MAAGVADVTHTDGISPTVAVLALDGVVAFDLATPVEVFGRTQLRDGSPAYEVRVCSAAE